MASHPSPLPPPPPVHHIPPGPTPTTITDLGDDELQEIFLRLPDLPTLASAAFTCRAFLGAVRSSRAFRRRFRLLQAPPLLPSFLAIYMYRLYGFSFLAQWPHYAGFNPLQDDDTSEWRANFFDYSVACSGSIAMEHRSTKQRVWYNPQTMALILHPKEGHGLPDGTSLHFHTLSPQDEEEEDQSRPSRVVCVRQDYSRPCARFAVFSSDTMEWQIFPETATPLPGGLRGTTRTVVDGFICWQCESLHIWPFASRYILVLNTRTSRFSRVDVPEPLRSIYDLSYYKVGQTKDGKLCIVQYDEKECTFSLWILTAGDDEGIEERFVMHNTFPLRARFMEVITGCSAEHAISVRFMAVFHGFVYFSARPWKNYVHAFKSPEWFLSFSLETGELKQHLKNRRRLDYHVHPYLLWPPSLAYSTEGSKYEVAGNRVEGIGTESIEKDSSAVIEALRSYKEALTKDGDANAAEIEAFSLCIDEDEMNSLVRKITALDELLVSVRDRFLSRVDADSEFYFYQEQIKKKRWWQMCKQKLWRVFPC